MVSIIIPALNEKDFIALTVSRCFDLAFDKEIIVIDNGSTDGTWELLQNLKRLYPADRLILEREPRKGKGNAVRLGIARAKGEFIALQDADLEYCPSYLHKMLPLLKNGYDAVYGVRECAPFEVSISSFIANKILLKLVNLKVQKSEKIEDIFTGQRMYRAEALRGIDLKATRFNIETELTLKGLKTRLKHIGVKVPYNPRSFLEGKKICFTDFLHILWTYSWIHYRGAN